MPGAGLTYPETPPRASVMATMSPVQNVRQHTHVLTAYHAACHPFNTFTLKPAGLYTISTQRYTIITIEHHYHITSLVTRLGVLPRTLSKYN